VPVVFQGLPILEPLESGRWKCHDAAFENGLFVHSQRLVTELLEEHRGRGTAHGSLWHRRHRRVGHTRTHSGNRGRCRSDDQHASAGISVYCI
jgi:hypothetical protein